MDKTMLTLKPDVTLAERGGQTSLALHGRVQFARDARQAEILRAVISQSQPLKNLVALLCERNDLQNDNDITLAIAEFILDFGDYLDT